MGNHSAAYAAETTKDFNSLVATYQYRHSITRRVKPFCFSRPPSRRWRSLSFGVSEKQKTKNSVCSVVKWAGRHFDARSLSTLDFICIIIRFPRLNFPLARPKSRHARVKSLATSGWSDFGLRANVMESVGQVDTHSPQPIHLSRSTDAFPFTWWTASIWQRSSQMRQPSQVSVLTTAKNDVTVKLAGLG